MIIFFACQIILFVEKMQPMLARTAVIVKKHKLLGMSWLGVMLGAK